MKKHGVQQKTERRISAALRLALVAFLLLAQIALIFLLSDLLRQRIAIAYIILELAALVAAIRIYNRPGGSTYKTGWILLVMLVPAAGLVLYLLWNGNRQRKQLTLKGLPMPRESEARQEQSRQNVEKLRQRYSEWGKLGAYLHRQGFPLLRNTRVCYLAKGETYLDDVLQCMERAEHFILVELFIMAEGQIWDRMTDILRRKAAQGVEIKLLFDDFGSMGRLPGAELERLRQSGVEVKIFNPVHFYVNRLYFNYRDHRKIISVDGDTVYTGGVNVGDEYANLISKFGYWKDGGVRLEGEGAWGLTKEFLHMWEELGGHMEREYDYYRPHTAAEAAGFCQSISDGPDNNPVTTAEDVFLQLIAGANHMVYITTPYLAIDDPMIKALCMAGDSGVDVRLMLPGIPDKKYAYLVAECYFGELLQHGVKIYNYTPGFLHSKMVVTDRQVAFVGSVNMDYRSFRLHFECGTVLYDMPVIEDILEDMDDIVASSLRVEYEAWKKRPWLHRAVGTVLRLFAIWM
ncbi:MAG: cardiolipin synthase [Oscillospiraceae bacterium]|nr:cardiolipin synthase [Oscillospiraceae bacterium]